LQHIVTLQTDSLSHCMSIDRATLRNLELTESLNGGSSKHTLLDLLDETTTPMGGRLLCHWIQHPLLACSEIQQRQEAIAGFLQAPEESQNIRRLLESVRDIERLMMKVSARYATPRDL